MTKKEIKKIISDAIGTKALCRVYMNFDPYYFYYYPLKMSNRLFLAAEEDDFILDGYTIRRFRDVKKTELKDDLCAEINKYEGNLDSLVCPDIDLTDWRTVFKSLDKLGRNIIIEDESDQDNGKFVIGRIENVCERSLYFRNFDSDGKWDDGPYEIQYSAITTVKIATRYADIFSKYISPLPENFGRI